jgi:hypothetical protein
MSRSCTRWAAVAALGIAAALDSQAAAAQAGVAHRMRVLLDVDAADEPEYLCVLGRNILERESTNKAAQKEGLEVRERQVFTIAKLKELRNLPSAPAPRDPLAQPVPASSTYDVLVGSPLSAVSITSILNADDSLRVRCTRNALTRSRDGAPRVLTLRLQPGSEANDATLTGLSMVGNLVTLQMTEAYVLDVPKALAVQSLGGDYVPSEPRFLSGEHEVSLPVAPVLRSYRLELPLSHEKVVGHRLSSCDGTSPQEVLLKVRPTEITLDVAQRRTQACLCPVLDGQAPPAACRLSSTVGAHPNDPTVGTGTVYVVEVTDGRGVVAKLATFGFTWTRHCGYAFETCPDVEVLGASASCSATPVKEGSATSSCLYHCVASKPVHSLPLDLEFSYPTRESPALEQRWPAKLTAVGQRLSAFVPSEQRRVVLELDGLCPGVPECAVDPVTQTKRCHPECVDDVNQELEYVALQFPDGRLVRIKPDTLTKVLDAPGLTCSDTIIYQYHGDQSWAEASVPVDMGRIRLPDTNSDFHNLVGFSVQAGAGLSFPSYDPSQLSSAPHELPVAKLEGLLSWRAFRTWLRVPLDLEGRFGGTVGKQWYETSRSDGASPAEPGIQTNRRNVPIARVLLHGGAVYHLPYGFYGGLTVGASNNRPLFVRDEAVVPQSFTFLGTARAGIALTRFLRAELEGLIFPAEPIRSFEYTPLGAPRPSDRSSTTFLAMISFRFDDPL